MQAMKLGKRNAASGNTYYEYRANRSDVGMLLGEAIRKKTTTAKKMCSKIIRREGVKIDGTLKKGYRYVKGGRIVKEKK